MKQDNSINIGDNNTFSGTTRIGHNNSNSVNNVKHDQNAVTITIQKSEGNESEDINSPNFLHQKAKILSIISSFLTILSGIITLKIWEFNNVSPNLTHVFFNSADLTNQPYGNSLIITGIFGLVTISSFVYLKKDKLLDFLTNNQF